MRIALAALLGAAILLVPVLWNGVAFLYNDTPNYLSRADAAAQWFLTRLDLDLGMLASSTIPQHGSALDATVPDDLRQPVISGRSIYYGMLAYLSYMAGTLWPLLIMQALMTSGILALLWYRTLGFRGYMGFAVLVAGLMLTTPIAFFVGLVMPDFLAPLLIVAAAMLFAAWPRLLQRDIWFLAVVASLAMVSHTSHLLLGIGLLMLVAVARLTLRVPNSSISIPGMGVLAGAIVLTLALNALFSVTVVRATGQPPIPRPHITANLVDDGPGIAFLERNCPESGFAICDYRDRLPLDWNAFLFGTDPVKGVFAADDLSPDIRRALGAEQVRFALAVLLDDPVNVIGWASRVSIRQLGRFAVHEIALSTSSPAKTITHVQAYFPPDLIAATRDSPLYADHRPLEVLTLLTYASAIAAFGGMLFAVATAGRTRSLADFRDGAPLVVLILLGIALNAVICGVLASPYDRFQARVIWLLPLAAVMALYFARSLERGRVPELPEEA